MRISISGAQNTGKTTLVKNFLHRWPMYGTLSKSYRDVLVENDLEHSSNTNEETQLLILDWMMQMQSAIPKDTNVIYDRCTWDNLAYTLAANANDKISDEVTAATISFVRESMKNIDIIFWIPFSNNIQVVDDGVRDSNIDNIKDIDNVFRQLFEHYSNDLGDDIFYPKEDCPAIIEVQGETVDDRLFFISHFIDEAGKLIEPDNSIFSDENLRLLEDMLKDQEAAKVGDTQMKKIIDEVSKYGKKK